MGPSCRDPSRVWPSQLQLIHLLWVLAQTSRIRIWVRWGKNTWPAGWCLKNCCFILFLFSHYFLFHSFWESVWIYYYFLPVTGNYCRSPVRSLVLRIEADDPAQSLCSRKQKSLLTELFLSEQDFTVTTGGADTHLFSTCLHCVLLCVQSVMPSSQDESIKDKPRPLSTISRQQRNKTHITRTASGTLTGAHTSPVQPQVNTHLSCNIMVNLCFYWFRFWGRSFISLWTGSGPGPRGNTL